MKCEVCDKEPSRCHPIKLIAPTYTCPRDLTCSRLDCVGLYLDQGVAVAFEDISPHILAIYIYNSVSGMATEITGMYLNMCIAVYVYEIVTIKITLLRNRYIFPYSCHAIFKLPNARFFVKERYIFNLIVN